MARDRLLSADNGNYRPLVAAADAPATWIANRARTVGIECSNTKVCLKRWSSSASPVPLANYLETRTEGADMRWVCSRAETCNKACGAVHWGVTPILMASWLGC